MDLAVAPGRVGPGDVHTESLQGNPLGRVSNQHEDTRVLAIRAWQTVQQSLGTIRAFDDVRLVFGGHAQPASVFTTGHVAHWMRVVSCTGQTRRVSVL